MPPPLNPKTNSNPNPNPNPGATLLVAIVWLLPTLENNPYLDPNPNPNRGAIFLGRQLSGYQKQMVCGLVSYISIALILAYVRNRLFKTLLYWSRDMLNFNINF